MYRSYKVRKGDHLDAIARDLETTRAILVEANHLKKPDALVPGQRLKVPIEKVYVAQTGDTVWAVAKRFGVEVADLADLNAIAETHPIRPGERLALPATFHDGGPVLAPATRFTGRFSPSSGYRTSRWPVSPPATGADGGAAGAYPSPLSPGAPTLSDSQVSAAGRGRFVWPVTGDVLSTFGVKDVGRRNDGVDVKAPLDTPVRAAAAGEVVYAGDQVPGFGNLVLVKHADGWVTAYAHLNKVSVKMRDGVSQGEEIGSVGQSGGVAEPQLHFEVRYAPTPVDKAKPVDPLLVLPK
jgi:murein DD-endopeptidase MepM/ murein hydrolase activator NlpD